MKQRNPEEIRVALIGLDDIPYLTSLKNAVEKANPTWTVELAPCDLSTPPLNKDDFDICLIGVRREPGRTIIRTVHHEDYLPLMTFLAPEKTFIVLESHNAQWSTNAQLFDAKDEEFTNDQQFPSPNVHEFNEDGRFFSFHRDAEELSPEQVTRLKKINLADIDYTLGLKQIVADYAEHLHQKLIKVGINPETLTYSESINRQITNKDQYLINRFNAMSKLKERIQFESMVNEDDKREAQVTLATCLQNLPDLSERSFIHEFNKNGQFFSFHPEAEELSQEQVTINVADINYTLGLKQLVADYSDHLHQKLINVGINPKTLTYSESIDREITKKDQCLINRFKAMSELQERIEFKPMANEDNKREAQAALATCLENIPDWSERSFLQKLTDVLSLGIKPLCRMFFSKESKLEVQLQNELEGPKFTGR